MRPASGLGLDVYGLRHFMFASAMIALAAAGMAYLSGSNTLALLCAGTCLMALLLAMPVRAAVVVFIFGKIMLDARLAGTTLSIAFVAIPLVLLLANLHTLNTIIPVRILVSLTLALLLASAWVVRAVILGSDWHLGLGEIVKWSSAVCVFLLVAHVQPYEPQNRRDEIRTIDWLIWAGMPAATLSVYQGVVQGAERAGATFVSPNVAATIYIVFMFVALHLLIVNVERRKSHALVALMYFLAVIVTATLGAFIALLLATLYWVVTVKDPRWWLALMGGATISAVALSETPLAQRLISLQNTTSLEEAQQGATNGSFDWRIFQWSRTLPFVREHLFVGHGLGSSQDIVMVGGYLPHSEPLRAALEIGILGSVVVAVLILWGYRKIPRIEKGGGWGKIVVVAVLTQALADNVLYPAVTLVVVAAALGLSVAIGGEVREAELGSKPDLSERAKRRIVKA